MYTDVHRLEQRLYTLTTQLQQIETKIIERQTELSEQTIMVNHNKITLDNFLDDKRRVEEKHEQYINDLERKKQEIKKEIQSLNNSKAGAISGLRKQTV